MLLYNYSVNANVTIAPSIGGDCLQLAPGGTYTVLSNMVISETNVNDFAIQSGTTYILTAPTGFEFNPGVGNVVFQSGRDITNTTLLVNASTITVTLTVAGNTLSDILRIRYIEVRSTAPNVSGSILRTIVGGTAIITGNAPGAGINHGSLYAAGTGGIFTTATNGVWSNPATWTGGVVPNCTDNVVINHQVNADVIVILGNVTINTGGNLISDQVITINGILNLTGSAVYTHNNTSDAPSTIFNGSESIASTSTIIVNNWSSYSLPFASAISGNIGNLTFNTTGYWNQSGLFAPARIQGTLTVNAGSLVLDDGSGMSTALTLKDVIISGSGRILFQTGAPRNLTLVTGNYTDNSTASGYSTIMYRSVGNLNWHVIGNLSVSHRFSVVEGLNVTDVGSAVIDVDGNFTISGGSFEGLKRATGSFNMNVDGTTLITGGPSLVAFRDYYDGDVTFISGTTTIDNSRNTYFQGTNSSTGIVTVTINGDLNVSGATTRVFLAVNASNLDNINCTVTNDVFLTDAQFRSTSGGIVNYIVGRNYNQSGTTSTFYGQYNTLGSKNTGITVNGSLSVTGGIFSQSRNLGSVVLNITEVLNVQNASFYGMNNSAVGNNGNSLLSCTDLNISGSVFDFHRGEITDGRTVTVNISSQLMINFTNATHRVTFISKPGNNNAVLDLNIGTNFFVTGTANGLFSSSLSSGAETVDIIGDLSVSAGRVRFNAYEGVSARGHQVTGNIGGNLTISGGSIALSSNRGLSNWNIAGDFDQSAGYSVIKWYNGTSNVNIQGNYSLVNSSTTLYSRATTIMADPVTVTINGNATFDNSVVMFDSCLTSTATHRMIFKGNNVTFNDNVVFDHRAHLSTRLIFGNIIYDKAGTVVVRRNASAFDIRHVKQIVTAGTTADFSTSPYDMMIASHTSSISATHTTLNVNGTLNMGEKMIVGRNQTNYYSSVNINNGGRLITAHANGLYSGTAAGSTVYPIISGNNRMNYFLHAGSAVEYNGTNNQIISGTGIGLAITPNHRYGILDINFQGTDDSEYAYPLNDEVYVRTSLFLTDGELNLDDDHVTNAGGRMLQVLNGATVSRANGYIRSETEDGSAAVRWNITTTGSFTVPFGYNSSEYIPFTYQPIAGSSGDVILATYHSAADNSPYPPTVTHVRDVFGADNSGSTVDRFWRIESTGSATSNLIFSVTTAERSGIVNPRAQLWEPVSLGWFPPTGVQSNPTANTTLANTINSLNTWWTLSSALSPLPVELISFEVKGENNAVRIDWVTAAEINNDFFTIEKSLNGVEFIDLSTVEGSGNSSTSHSYTAYDKSPSNGINYYRLKQTDFDGKESWSEIRSVSFKKAGLVSIYPNPLIGSEINLYTSDDSEVVSVINFYDLAGKLVLKLNDSGTAGNKGANSFEIGEQLANGTYVVEVNTNSGVYRERIVKQ